MATRTSSTSGLWSSAATWGGAGTVSDGDTVIISNGDTVIFNEDMTGWSLGVKLTVNGTLTCSTIANTYHLMLGVGNTAGTGYITAGTDAVPLPSTVTFIISITGAYYVQSTRFNLNCIEPTNRYVKLSTQENSGQTILSVDTNVTGDIWAIGDDVLIADKYGYARQKTTITNITSTTITVNDALAETKVSGTKIVLLERNIKFQGTGSGTYTVKDSQYSRFGCYIINSIVNGFYGTDYCEYIGTFYSTENSGLYAGSGNHLSGVFTLGVGASQVIYAMYGCKISGAIIIGCNLGYRNPMGCTFENTIFEGCNRAITGGYGNNYFFNCDFLYNVSGTYTLYGSNTFVQCTFDNTIDISSPSRTGPILGYNTALNGTTQVSSYRSTSDVGQNTYIHMQGIPPDGLDPNDYSPYMKVWTNGGYVTTELVGIGISSLNHKLTFVDAGNNFGVVGDYEFVNFYTYYDVPFTLSEDNLVEIDVWLEKDTNSMNITPRAQIIDTARLDPIEGGTPLAEEIMADNTNEQRFLLSYHNGYDKLSNQLVLRIIGSNNSGTCKSAYWMKIKGPRDFIYNPSQSFMEQ